MAITSTWKTPVNHASFKKNDYIFSTYMCISKILLKHRFNNKINYPIWMMHGKFNAFFKYIP